MAGFAPFACSSEDGGKACADEPDCAPYGVVCPAEAPVDGMECKLVRGGAQSGCSYTVDGGAALAQCVCTATSYTNAPCPAAWSYTGGCSVEPPAAGSACPYQKTCEYPDKNVRASCVCTQTDTTCAWSWTIKALCPDTSDGSVCDAQSG